MLRVRDSLHAADSQPSRVRPSGLRPIAEACDEWFYLRCRAEQMTAEANSMVPDDAPLDLRDEYGTDQLAFLLECGGRSARFLLGRTGRKGWVELRRSYEDGEGPVEPIDTATIEDVVIELLAADWSIGVVAGEAR